MSDVDDVLRQAPTNFPANFQHPLSQAEGDKFFEDLECMNQMRERLHADEHAKLKDNVTTTLLKLASAVTGEAREGEEVEVEERKVDEVEEAEEIEEVEEVEEKDEASPCPPFDDHSALEPWKPNLLTLKIRMAPQR